MPASGVTIVKVTSGSAGERLPNPTGGVETAELAGADAVSNFASQVADVHVVCNRIPDQPLVEKGASGLVFHRLQNRLSYEESNSATYSEEFGVRAADLVLKFIAKDSTVVVEHTSAIPAACFATALEEVEPAIRSRVLFVYSVHNSLFLTDEPRFIFKSRSPEWSMWRRAELKAIQAADVVVCPSRDFLAQIQRSASISPEQCVVIPNTVGPPLATLPDKRRYVLFMGRLAAEKRVDLLLRAFSDLDSSIRMQTGLVICGDGPERSELQALAEELGLAVKREWPPVPGGLAFVGTVSGKAKEAMWLSSCLHVCPSESEVSPVVGYEGLRYGVPAITSGLAAWRELIESGRTGFSIPLEQWPQSATAAIAGLLKDDRWKNLAHNCMLEYASRFSPEAIARERARLLYTPFLERLDQ